MVDENLLMLYQEIILDHGRHPRHCHKIDPHNHTLEGYNPLCGDKLNLYLQVSDENVIEKASFQGQGCAISMASASMMLEAIQNVSIEKAHLLFAQFHAMTTSKEFSDEVLGKLTLLEGVKAFPSRIKCANLAWHTLEGCLNHRLDPVNTEED